MIPIVLRDVQTARPAENPAVFLAGKSDGRCINDGTKFRHVIAQHSIEQLLVAVLQTDQIKVFFEVVWLAANIVHYMLSPLGLREDAGWKQSAQSKRIAPPRREGGPFIQTRFVW